MGPQLVVNGDFSDSIAGFTSDYVYGTGGISGILQNDGQFAIATNPNDTHIDFDNYGDHTTGTGQMLVVNGAGAPNVSIWCQTITVLPNTTYFFSTWAATANWQSPAVLQFSINGDLMGSPFSLTSTTGVWSQFAESWFSGANTTATICIVNQNPAIGGNDFTLDDISFTTCDSVPAAVGCNFSVTATANAPVCVGDTVIMTATDADGYLWSPSR